MSARPATQQRTRLHTWASILGRVLAATVGGYGLAALVATTAALVWPLWAHSRAEAVQTASLWAFAVHTVAAIAVCAARSTRRAWLGLALATLVCAGLGAVLRLLA